MQAEHLRGFRDHAARGLEMSRLCVFSWDLPGRCDTRAMTYVLNAHLRRHDTYRSWFEFGEDDQVIRHTMPEASDIEIAPTRHGQMDSEEWQDLIRATPDPLQWDCFRFMLIQRADHFTFCLAVDHLHIDAMFLGTVFTEIHLMYVSLAGGGAPLKLPEAGSYQDFCTRQQEYLSSLTLESPEIRAWVEFFESNDGTLPRVPVSLGDGSGAAEIMSVRLLDERQTADFEAACTAAGVRYSGGVFACAALADAELTGADQYHGVVAVDTRNTPEEFVTTGWFTSFIPVSVKVGSSPFSEIARAAQTSFDEGRRLMNVPFARVLEVAPWLTRPVSRVPLLFYLDVGVPPLSALLTKSLENVSAGGYLDGGVPAQFDIRVNRLEKETMAAVMFPSNPVARESVNRYLTTLKAMYLRVAEGRDPVATLRRVAHA
jgi:mycolipenoyl-CoA---2-(long-chain-fatty acyl)-trehalose mycolipenoyltransferase / long-chain-acyl-CoA---trehalose acyltransferase